MAATSVVVLDRGNNTTCTINLHGKHELFPIRNPLAMANFVREEDFGRTVGRGLKKNARKKRPNLEFFVYILVSHDTSPQSLKRLSFFMLF